MQHSTANIQHRTFNKARRRRPLDVGRSMLGVGCFPVLLGLLLFSFGPLRAQPVSREYQLKAAFLYNFAQFTEWPTNAFAAPDAPLVVGVLGVDPFGSFLDQTVRGEIVDGRRLVVERYRRVEELKTCHILFISRSEDRRLEEIVSSVKTRPILTISDIENAAYRGAMIQFLTESNRIRFRIHLPATQEAGLTLSSQLLRVSEVITPEKKP